MGNIKHIIFTGASGVGKTTIVRMFEERLGIKPIKELIRELHKSTGLKINQDGGIETQRTLFDMYMDVLKDDDSWTLSDRGMCDVIGYTKWLADHAEEKGINQYEIDREQFYEQENFRKWWSRMKDNTLIVFFPIEFELKADGVRSTDSQYQKEVSANIEGNLRACGVDYLTVHGNPEERYEMILNMIGPDFGVPDESPVTDAAPAEETLAHIEEEYQKKIAVLEAQKQDLLNTIEEYKAQLLRIHMKQQALE